MLLDSKMWNIEYMRVIKKDEAIKINTISMMRGQGEVSTSCGSVRLQSACGMTSSLGGGLSRWAVKLSPCHPELVSGSDQPQIPKQVRNDNLSRRCLCLV